MLAGALSAAWAQMPAPSHHAAPTSIESAPGAAPIRLDAVVTDAAGRRVLTLEPSDFVVTVNGIAQPLAGAEVRTPPQPRVFVLFLDEYHVSPGPASARVREALARFIDTQLRATDRVAIVKPLQPVAAIGFSTDRGALKAAVASFDGRKGDLAPRSVFEEQFIGHAPAAVAAARAQIVTLALTELAVQLGELRAARAALVLVSEGFQRGTQGLSRRQGRLPDLQGVARAASRFHFAVYALSPEDVAAEALGAGTLGWLAAQTGGVSATVAAALDSSLVQVAADMDAYYALHLPAPPTDGRFHRVEISTTRSGLRVRAGSGFWAPLSSEVRARFSGNAPLAPPRALRRSPLIDAWVGLRPDADGRLALSLSWMPAAAPASSAANLLVTARSEAGDVLFEGRVAAVGEADAVARFVAPPGRILLDMDVVGEDGRVLDTDVRDAHVPHFTSDVTLALLPPEVLRARTIPEYRRIVQDSAAVPTPLRVFARSDRLVIRTPLWHAGGGDVHVRARVLNRRGQAMREVDRLGVTADGVASFDLPLSWLAPGEYYIEVAAAAGERVVGERINFRVTG
jgi:VWFA-related protein